MKQSLSSRVWVQTRPVIRFGADFPLLKITRFPAFCKIVFVFIFLQGVWWKKSFSWNSFWWHLQDTAWFAGKVLGRAGKNRSLLFVWYCTVCCKVEKKYCTFCCKVEKSIVQSAVKLTKSIVQFVVKTGVVCALIHDRKKFHGRGTLLLLVKNDAELVKMKTTCTSDK